MAGAVGTWPAVRRKCLTPARPARSRTRNGDGPRNRPRVPSRPARASARPPAPGSAATPRRPRAARRARSCPRGPASRRTGAPARRRSGTGPPGPRADRTRRRSRTCDSCRSRPRRATSAVKGRIGIVELVAEDRHARADDPVEIERRAGEIAVRQHRRIGGLRRIGSRRGIFGQDGRGPCAEEAADLGLVARLRQQVPPQPPEVGEEPSLVAVDAVDDRHAGEPPRDQRVAGRKRQHVEPHDRRP